MKQRLKQRYALLSQREKIVVLVAGIIAIVMLGYFHVVEPQFLRHQALQVSIEEQKVELNALLEQQQVYINHLQNDINAALRSEKEAQDDMLKQLDIGMSAFLSKMVKPTEMTQVITDLLAQLGDVKVVSLKSIPPRLFAGDSNNEFHLYEHGLKLTLQAPYAKLHAFLAGAEGLPWQFHWQDYELTVAQYPYSQLSLELKTYSLSKEFIQL